MKRLTVMYISHSSRLEGAPQSLLDSLKYLKKYCRTVVAIPEHGMIEERLKQLDIKYYVVPMECGYGAIGCHTKEDEEKNFLNNYHAALKLKEIVAQENVDLIHSNSIVFNAGVFAAIMTNRPHVWHIREFLEEDFQKELWDKSLKLELLKATEKMITVSQSIKEAYRKKYSIDSIQIYNGIDIEKFLDETHRKKQENTFLLAGSFIPGKGQWDAVRAANLLIKEGIDIRLTMIGGQGNIRYVWAIKRYIKQNGLESHITVSEFVSDLEVLRKEHAYSLTCSKMEALGRVTIEAMLAGNIVIGANTGGTRELIGEDQQRGYLYEAGNHYDLARVLKEVIEDSDEHKLRKKENAQFYVKENFHLKGYSEKLLKIYEEVLENRGKSGDQQTLNVGLKERFLQLKQKEYFHIDISDELYESRAYWAERYWPCVGENKKLVNEFFAARGIKSIGIYGMGGFGCRLYDVLEQTNINIAFVYDKDRDVIGEVVPIKDWKDEVENVDAVLISVVREEEKIKKWMEERCQTERIGITELIEYCKKSTIS